MPELKRSERLMELYRRGSLDPKKMRIIDVAKQKGVLDSVLAKFDMSTPEQPQTPQQELVPDFISTAAHQDEPGVLDYIMGVGEVAGTMVTGAVAEPVSGIAGLAKTITSGPEAGAKTVEQIQEAMTYTRRTMGGQAVGQKIGEVLEPITEMAGKVSGAIGEAGFKAAGPVGGAAVKTLLAAIPEVLGLKGTRAAKKLALRKMVKEKDVSQLYDELGNLMPEIQKGLDNAGIDVSELEDILPQQVDVLEKPIEKIGEAAKKQRVRPSKIIAEEIKPSREILEAAEEFGLSKELLPSHYSDNPTYRAIEQGLKSVPGSKLSAREEGLVKTLAAKTDELITEFGGIEDKAELSDLFRTKSTVMLDDLESQSSDMFRKVRNAIPDSDIVETDNIIGLINDRIRKLGSKEDLTTHEKRLLSRLDPKKKPTYTRLDQYRKQIGATLGRKSDTFKDSDTGFLKKLYGALAEDQKKIAIKHDVGKMYDAANKLTVTRKGIEKQLVGSLGKKLSGSITAKAGLAMRSLQKGNTKAFDELLENIPDQLGKDMRQSIVATALNDAFVQGSRMQKALNIPAFDDYMNGIKRNKASYRRVEKELGKDAMNRLSTFHTVVSGVREAQKKSIGTGLIMAVPKMFDETEGIAQRLYGVAEMTGKPFGLRPPGIIESMVIPKTPRSMRADEFLASPKFKRILDDHVKNKLNTDANLKQAEKTLESLKEYKRWKDTLPERDLKDLAAVGAIGYLTGEAIGEK